MLASHPEFMCGICSELLYKPKDLPCHHRFCCACLKSHCVNKGSGHSFLCPTCQKETKIEADIQVPLIELPDKIKTNLIIEKQLEKFHTIRRKKNIRHCILCFAKWKMMMATKFCRSCDEYFCNECGNQHWLLRSSKAHRVWLIEDILELNIDPYIRANLTLMFNAKIKPIYAVNDPNTIDLNTCQISGATYFPDGKLVIVDTANQKLKLFDRHLVLRSHLFIQGHDTLAVNALTVVVSCPEINCLIIFNLDFFELRHEHTIETAEKCYGLCYIDSNLFYSASAGNPVCLLKFDQTELLERIEIGTGKIPLSTPHYIAVSQVDDVFCISDMFSKCVKCTTNTGDMLWERQINDCGGVISFTDYFLLCRQNRKTVDIVRKDGEILKSLLTNNEALAKVTVLAANTWKQEFGRVHIAVMDDTDLINVYTPEDPLSDIDWSLYSRGDNIYRRSSSMKRDGTVSNSCQII